jgi:hypothetical protein
MKPLLCLVLLASVVAPAKAAAPALTTAGTVNVLVTDRRGKPLPSAHVIITGVPERRGSTNSAGRVVFREMETGSYTLRVERDKFITFEKDFAVGGEKGSTHVVAAISPLTSLAQRTAKARTR